MTTVESSAMMPGITEWTFTVQVWPDPIDGGFVAECMDLPGCMSQGDTEQEALDNVRSAVEELLASLVREWKDASSGQSPGHRPGSGRHRHEIKVVLTA